MRYLSVCSGIGSETVAWHSLGWECAAFAETDKHASAVLEARFPNIPNLGDFTEIGGNELGGNGFAVNVLRWIGKRIDMMEGVLRELGR